MSTKRIKKKTNPHPNTIASLASIDIDYDKLAEILITAQNGQERQKEKPEEKNNQKIGFFKAVWLIMRGKKDTKDRMTVGLMSIPLSILFKTFSVVVFFTLPVSIYAIAKQCISMTWTVAWTLVTNILTIVLSASILFIVFIFSVLIWGASNEIEKSDDKHFIAAIFSGIVSLAALVVSFIALKG